MQSCMAARSRHSRTLHPPPTPNGHFASQSPYSYEYGVRMVLFYSFCTQYSYVRVRVLVLYIRAVLYVPVRTYVRTGMYIRTYRYSTSTSTIRLIYSYSTRLVGCPGFQSHNFCALINVSAHVRVRSSTFEQMKAHEE